MALVPIVLAQRGLTGESDPMKLRTGDMYTAENVSYAEGNILQKDPGAERITPNPAVNGERIIAGWDWWPIPTGQRRVVGTIAGKLYKDRVMDIIVTPGGAPTRVETPTAGTFPFVLTDSWVPGHLIHFAEGGLEAANKPRLLFCANSVNAGVVEGDQNTLRPIRVPSPDWTANVPTPQLSQPRGFFGYNGRMGAFGAPARPHFVYFSKVDDHEDFVGGGSEGDPNFGILPFTPFFNVYPGEGFRISAAISAMGRAWLFKNDYGVYSLVERDSSVGGPGHWAVTPVSRDFGVIDNAWGVTQIGAGTIAFLTPSGSLILMRETAGTLTGIEFIDLFERMNIDNIIRREMNRAELIRSQLIYYEERRQLHITYSPRVEPEQNPVGMHRRMVIDFQGETTRIEISTFLDCDAVWLERDQDRILRPVTGTGSGLVYRLLDPPTLAEQMRTAAGIDGQPIPMKIETAPTDFSDIATDLGVLKNFHAMHLEFLGRPTAGLVDVSVMIDGKDKGLIQFDLNAQWPIESGAFRGTPLTRWMHAMSGDGYYISLRIEERSLANPKLIRCWLDVEPVGMAR